MLTNRCMMAETQLSRDYERKQLELIKKGSLCGPARYFARIYALQRERKRNADKSRS